MVEALARHARIEHRTDGRLPPLPIEFLNEFIDAYSGELRTLLTNVLVNDRGKVFA